MPDAQHVLAGAVAEIDAEAEGGSLADTVGGKVDDGDVAAAGKQDLRGDLAETREADHQHVGAGALEILIQRPRASRPSDSRFESAAPNGVSAIESVTMAISSDAVLDGEQPAAGRSPW
jgi:hypothetical protein